MGLFDFMKKKGIELTAPAEGECVPLSQVNDPTFSEEILGKGVAVIPENGTICAPADGEVSTVFPTGHAVALTTPDGVEVLIHIGLDTVKLEGKHFSIKAQTGQKTADVIVCFKFRVVLGKRRYQPCKLRCGCSVCQVIIIIGHSFGILSFLFQFVCHLDFILPRRKNCILEEL